MKFETMLPIAAALSLALAAGCERRASEETTGSTKTTSATPSQLDDMTRDAASSITGAPSTAGVPGTSDTAGATGTTAITGATVEQPLDEHDKEFIIKAASANMAQVALGTTASQNATLPEVKSFGNRMMTDHAKANDELKALAAKKGVSLPTEMEKAPKNEQERLSTMTGKKFDKEYAEFAVKDHERDLKEFQKAAKEAKDPDVKAWAAKMVPILEEHLNSAKQLKVKP